MIRRLRGHEPAFDELRRASQVRHVKIRELAEDVVLTGTLDD